MGFIEAVAAGFKNYINFSTRSSRSEYWYWTLFNILVSIATLGIDVGLMSTGLQFSPVNMLASLALFIPSISVSVRRLHDIGKSGWWLLLALLPIIGWLVLIYWYIKRGEDGTNDYGANPLGAPAVA